MDRLTNSRGECLLSGTEQCNVRRACDGCERQVLMFAVLADYEETGLTAWQVKNLQSELLKAKTKQLLAETERDAILADLTEEQCCAVCKHGDNFPDEPPCSVCDDDSMWAWRGLREDDNADNTPDTPPRG